MLVSVIVLLLVLNLLIFVHEFGHLIMALKAGVKVYEFSLGFGPKLVSKKIKGITVSLRAIPLGGFVNLEDESYKKDSLLGVSVFRQYMVLLGGVFFNLILGLIVLSIVLIMSNFKVVVPVADKPIFADVYKEHGYCMLVGAQKESSLAVVAKNGLDNKAYAITRVADTKVEQCNDLLVVIKKFSQDTVVDIELLDLQTNTSKIIEAKLLPNGKLGIQVIDYATYVWDYSSSVVKKLTSAVLYSMDTMAVSFDYLKEAISEYTQNKDSEALEYAFGSPVALYPAVDQIMHGKSVVVDLLQMIGLLSLNLAILNVLPIPPLDGWHLIFMPLKKYKRKSRLLSIMTFVTFLGIMLIIVLSILLIVKDIKLFILN